MMLPVTQLPARGDTLSPLRDGAAIAGLGGRALAVARGRGVAGAQLVAATVSYSLNKSDKSPGGSVGGGWASLR